MDPRTGADGAEGQLVRRLLAALIAGDDEVPPRFRRGDETLDAATYLASLNDHTAVQLAATLNRFAC